MRIGWRHWAARSLGRGLCCIVRPGVRRGCFGVWMERCCVADVVPVFAMLVWLFDERCRVPSIATRFFWI